MANPPRRIVPVELTFAQVQAPRCQLVGACGPRAGNQKQTWPHRTQHCESRQFRLRHSPSSVAQASDAQPHGPIPTSERWTDNIYVAAPSSQLCSWEAIFLHLMLLVWLCSTDAAALASMCLRPPRKARSSVGPAGVSLGRAMGMCVGGNISRQKASFQADSRHKFGRPPLCYCGPIVRPPPPRSPVRIGSVQQHMYVTAIRVG